jgi:putative hemolysin
MYVLLTFGILFPKKLAAKYPDGWAYTFIRYIQLLRTILYPLTWLIAVSANLLLRLFGLKNTDEQADVTEEEIISMVNEGHELGVIEAGEVEMITNIFEFGDKKASDIMTHRNNITAIDSTMPFKDALNFMLEESNSRYPVYEESLDHIIGVLYLKDAMRMHTSNENLNQPIGQVPGLFREAVFVPETKNIDDLFRSMQSEKNQMVIVMDEYGQTSGLVTMEDILEEIVGNIMDEYDNEENHIEEKGENEYVIEGMTRLEDLEERFGISFGETEFETLNGYIISKLDRIPDEDENFEVEVDGYNFKIVKVEKNVIQSVLVTRVSHDDK